jgi:hypothetical protein
MKIFSFRRSSNGGSCCSATAWAAVVLLLSGCAGTPKHPTLVVEKYRLGGVLRKEVPYINGKRHGATKVYDSAGNVVAEEIYEHGKLISVEAAE